jgi:hypothetical protein
VRRSIVSQPSSTSDFNNVAVVERELPSASTTSWLESGVRRRANSSSKRVSRSSCGDAESEGMKNEYSY